MVTTIIPANSMSVSHDHDDRRDHSVPRERCSPLFVPHAAGRSTYQKRA
jgi:hypothetical protein